MDELLYDRGNLKWTQLILPEHRKALKQLQDEQEDILEKPILSEDKIQDIAYVLSEAYQEQPRVVIRYYKDKRIRHVAGLIKRFNQSQLSILEEDFTHIIHTSCITDAEFAR